MNPVSAKRIFAPTLKAVHNVSIISHQLLLRAGFMRQVRDLFIILAGCWLLAAGCWLLAAGCCC